MVTQPMGTHTQGDITSPVTGPVVASQDRSPVHDSAHTGSPFSVIHCETAAQSFEVSTEVYSAIDSESDAISVGQGHLECLSRTLFQSSNDEEAWRLIRPNHWARSSHSCVPSYIYSSAVILQWVELGWHHSWMVTWSCSSSWCRR